MSKIVAFDMDGILANHHHSFSTVANKLFGTPIVTDINDVKQYNWQLWHPLTKNQVDLTWKEIKKNYNNFWFNAYPLVTSDIFKRIKDLEENNSIYFVTKRPDTAGSPALHQTTEWITMMSGLSNFSVIPTNYKGKIISGIEADYFIDDLPENIIEVSMAAPKCKSYLLIRPYNTYCIDFIKKSHKYKNVDFIYSVDEFLDIIEKERG